MSLATRCPVCQTVFRVVQDQLKVSEGWVRCGRCAKVFNAFEGLFDLEREFPALRQSSPSQRVLEDLATRNRQPKTSSTWEEDFDSAARAPARPPAAPGPAPLATSSAAPAAKAPSAASAATSTTAPPPRPMPSPAAAAAAAAPKDASPVAARSAPTPGAAPATTRPGALADAGPVSKPALPVPTEQPAPSPPAPAPPAPARPAAAAAARAGEEIAIRDEPAPVPGTVEADAAAQDESFDALFRSDGELAPPDTAADLDINLDSDVQPAALDDAVDSRLLTFVQQADRAERWRRPWVRVAVALAALALTALLATQLLVAQRDSVVAQWPGMRPLVQALCSPLDCRVEPLRRIDSLGVESSGLTRIDDGPVYRLVLVLHNRGDTPLLMPAIDLTLTDTGGALVTRRVLSAAELGTPRTTIGPGQELPLQALLMSADRALAGYTIEIFYP